MQIVKSSFIFCCMISIISIAGAQPDMDSLQNIISNSKNDKEKIKAYKKLAAVLVLKDFDATLFNATAGIVVAKKLKDSLSLAELQKTTGLAYYFKGNYDSAAAYYYKALDLLKRNNYPSEKAAVLNELGKLYRKTRDLDRALQMYDEALEIYKNLNDDNGMATIFNESGVVFEYKADYEEAINRYKKSLAIREKMNDINGKAYSINFIGGVYTLQKKFAEAEKYLLESLELRRQLKDTFAMALNYTDLGYMYTQQGNFDKAMQQYTFSNDIAVAMKYPELLSNNYKELSIIAEQKGNMPLSLQYFKQHTTLKDSIYTNDKMKQIEMLNAKYQTEKKEQQLKLQKATIAKKNYLLWGLSACFVLLALAGFAFYRKRQVQHTLNLQAEVMKQQDIATRAVLAAEENERKRIAADLHDGVGQMMSAAKMNLSAFEDDLPFKDASQKLSYEKIIHLVDESCREIRHISHQMMPNALLKSGLANAIREFIDKIDSRIIQINLYAEGLHERLNSDVETVLYRVIQECVNNVIKHSGASTLDISLIKDADGIAATIEDNGKGFDVTDGKKMEGIGLKNIISRVEFLKGTVDFDSQAGKGTLIAIHVPFA